MVGLLAPPSECSDQTVPVLSCSDHQAASADDVAGDAAVYNTQRRLVSIRVGPRDGCEKQRDIDEA